LSEVLTREIDALRLLMGSPRDPHGRVFAQLGDALRRAGAHREALDILLDGVSEHPNFAPGHLVLGWTAQEAGDFEVARTAYERTVELDPENPNGLFGLGRLLDRDGDSRGRALIEEAESLDLRVRDVAPGFPGLRALHDPPTAEDDSSLAALPFMSLAELAPDSVAESRDTAPDDLSELPFVALDDLAPDADADDPGGLPEGAAEGSGEDDRSELPFVALDDLAPDADDPDGLTGVAGRAAGEDDLSELPFVAVDDLRPDEFEEGGELESPAASGELDEDEESEVLAGPLATRTMGELLVRQGLTAQAIEVFETLVARSPDDEELQHRLDELRGAPVPRSTDALDDPDELATHPSMDPPVPHPEVPSPFHPGHGEDDEVAEEEGQTVGDYFARLLAWSPTDPGPEPQASGEPSEGEEPASS
jgi:tetratricopeptide (TPR) repeat protein